MKYAHIILVLITAYRISAAMSPAQAAEPLGLDHWLRGAWDLDMLPLPRPGVKTFMNSSACPFGTNNDSRFATPNALDKSAAHSNAGLNPQVLMDVEGPGAITRIWTASADHQAVAKFFFDGEPAPSLTLKWRQLFDGSFFPFVAPLAVSEDTWDKERKIGHPGACYNFTYFPIPFAKSCRLEVENWNGMIFHQINVMLLPPDAPVKTFSPNLTEPERNALDEAMARLGRWGHNPRPEQERGNLHTVQIAAPVGENVELARFEGPAVITSFRVKGDHLVSTPGHAAIPACVLQVYWDGEESPGIQAPIEYFFGNFTRTLALGKTDDGWHYCYLPMPFARSARFSILNQGTDEQAIQAEFEVKPMNEIPKDTGYLRALFRMDNPTRLAPVPAYMGSPVSMGAENYLVLDAAGSGNYVGTLLMTQAGGMEGDEHFFIDGESWPPSYSGTGQEDYYNIAWGQRPVSFPTHGCVIEQWKAGVSLLRIHLNDLAVFHSRFHGSFEHDFPNTRRNVFASVAYWYQTEPGVVFAPPMPILARRWWRDADRWKPSPRDGSCPAIKWELDKDAGRFSPILPWKADTLKIVSSENCSTRVQDTLGYGTEWCGHNQLLVETEAGNAAIELELPPVPETDNYALCAWLTHGADYGAAEFFLNGVKRGESDCGDTRGGLPARRFAQLGEATVRGAEPAVLRVELQSRPGAERGKTLFGIDALYFQPKPRYAPAWWTLGPLSEDIDPDELAINAEISLGKDAVFQGADGAIKWILRKPNDQGWVDPTAGQENARGRLHFAMAFLKAEEPVECPLRLEAHGPAMAVFLNGADLTPAKSGKTGNLFAADYVLDLESGVNTLLVGGAPAGPPGMRAWIKDMTGAVSFETSPGP